MRLAQVAHAAALDVVLRDGVAGRLGPARLVAPRDDGHDAPLQGELAQEEAQPLVAGKEAVVGQVALLAPEGLVGVEEEEQARRGVWLGQGSVQIARQQGGQVGQ